MLKRKIKKLTKAMFTKMSKTKVLVCKECGAEEVQVSADTKSVTCGYCVQLMVAPPENYEKKEKSDKPRGWHFKSYFEHNGQVFSRGELVTDKQQIAELKKSYGKAEKSKKPATKPRGKSNARASR